MKLLNFYHDSKKYLSFIPPIILSVVIWVAGPFLAIGNYHPLLGPTKRYYLIVLLFLLWTLKIFLLNPSRLKKASVFSAEQLKKILALQLRFKGAIQFLKKTSLNKQGKKISLFQLPWYLLIGPQNSGKTTLLANSDINFILAKQFKQEDLKWLKPSDNYDWWVTRNLVLIDVPSNHILEEKNHFLWQHFLNSIKKFRRKKTLNGVVITLNLPELIKQDYLSQKDFPFISLKNCILQLKKQFDSHMPFYLAITKCDQLPGFIEFFGGYTNDELAQTWGITIPPLNQNEKLIGAFLHRFNALIKQLNKQLILHLHQERNQNAKSYIKDFPLQIERVKEGIVNFLKIIDIPNLNLQGIYLTSAIQSNHPEEQSAQLTHQASSSNHQLKILNPPMITRSRPFFIKQFLLQGILNTFEQPSFVEKKIWQNRIAYTTAISVLTIATFLFGYDFQQGIRVTYSLQNLLAQYQIALQHEHAGIDHLAKTLPLLDALQDTVKLQHSQLSRFANLFPFYTKKSQKTAEQLYHQALQTIVMPEIKNFLESYLKNSSDKNPVRLYAVLKAYLMLNNIQSLENDFMLNTIDQLLPNHFSPREHAELTHHLKIALNELRPLQLEDDLILKTRKLLFSFQHVQLAFIILKNIENNNLDSSISLGTNQGTIPALTTKEIENQIPNMFTAVYFQTILLNQIPQAASQALNGNKILGQPPTKTTPAEEMKLVSELEKKYITNYVDIWESLLANIQIVTPNSLAQTDSILATLTSNTSPLIQLLQTLQQNTTFSPILSASPKLQTLNALLININNKENSLYQIFVGLRVLHNYLQNILHTTNASEAAFFAAKIRIQSLPLNDAINQMRELAEKSPEPIKGWLEKLTDHSWHFILEEAAHHIQNHWQTTITPIYTTLANQFPLKPNTKEEINLQEFTQFFNPHGTLISFYQTFLKPFTNESPKEWEWHRFDNTELPLSKTVLQQIQYALQLQHALFPNNDNKLFVPFTLQPVSMDKNTYHVSLNMNGQLLAYQKASSRLPRLLTWPGNNAPHNTMITFSTTDHLPIHETIEGDWGWFHLINQATQTMISPQEVSLTLTMNNHTVKFKLLTQSHLNPFLLSNWEKLQLPEDLV